MTVMTGYGNEGISEMVVTVVSVTATGQVMVRDSLGNEMEVSYGYRPKGTGIPVAGERWLMVKRMGIWTLDALIDPQDPPVITGDRDGIDPILSQIIDLLASQGLIIDETTPAPEITPVDDDVLPEDALPEFVEETDEGPLDYTQTDFPEADPNTPQQQSHHPHNTGDENHPHPPDPTGKHSRLSVITYNQYWKLGPTKVQNDVNRLLKTRASLINFQEAGPTDRQSIYSSIPGWGYFHPTNPDPHPGDRSPDSLISVWDTSVLRKIDHTVTRLCFANDGESGKWAVAIRFEHKPSGLIFTNINTHLCTKAARKGVWDPSYHIKFVNYKASLDTVVEMVRNHSKHGPVMLNGDFNYHWEMVVKHGFPEGLPRTRFRNIGMHSNWEVLGMGPVSTRVGSGWIDYQWLKCATPGLIVPEWQRVLQRYHSDHRPVLVTYRVRNRTGPATHGR